MKEVYGWDFQDGSGDFWALTADHLFADIWSRPALDIPQRRLMLIGALTAANKLDVAELQLQCAYEMGELNDEQLREIVIFLAHYLGWPTAGALTPAVEKMIAKRAKAAAAENA
jgi:4-carboxymuconolactone decarboxylase